VCHRTLVITAFACAAFSVLADEFSAFFSHEKILLLLVLFPFSKGNFMLTM
jgi:hypothetical protein